MLLSLIQRLNLVITSLEKTTSDDVTFTYATVSCARLIYAVFQLTLEGENHTRCLRRLKEHWPVIKSFVGSVPHYDLEELGDVCQESFTLLEALL